MRRLAATALIALLGVLLPQPAGASTGVNRPDYEQEFVAAINQVRAEQGLPALEVDAELTAKARGWSDTMLAANDIWHSNLPDGVTANWKRLGENVGMGGSVDALHDAFVASPKHYENLVDPGFRFVGLGVSVNEEGTLFVTQEFMELASQPAPAAPRPAAGTPTSSAPAAPAEPPAPTAPAPSASPAPRAAEAPVAQAAVSPGRTPTPRVMAVLDRLRALDDA